MLFGRAATGALYLSYLPLIHAIAITVPRFPEETEIDNLVLIRSSEETEIHSLVLISAYLFPDQSSFEFAIKDPAWHQYDKADPSTYWSTGKQDVQNPSATIATYAYTADNLERRGDDGYVAIEDGGKKHKYLGLLGLIPGAAIGAGLYHIGHKTYTLKHAKPTGVNIAAPWTPTNVNPPDILKPGKLGEIVTNCGGALGPGDVPRPPVEPPIKVPGPPQEINVPKHPQASPPQGRKPIEPENGPKLDQSKPGEQPKTGEQTKTGDQLKTGDQPKNGDKSKPGKPIKPEELSKPADPPKPAEPPKLFDSKPIDPGSSKPPVDHDPFPYGRKPLDPNAPDVMKDHVPTGPPERLPPEPPSGKPIRPFKPPPAKPVEPQNPSFQERPAAKTPWDELWEQKAAEDPKKVQENLEKIEKEVDQQKKAEQAAERQRKLIEEQKETERLIEEQKRLAEEEAKRAQRARQEAEQLAEQERKATEQAKHAEEVKDRIEIDTQELEKQMRQKMWDERKAEDQAWAREQKRLEDAKKAEMKEAAKNAKKQAEEAKKAGGEAKKATQQADLVVEEGKTTQQHLKEMLEVADDMEQRAEKEMEQLKKLFAPMDDRDKKLDKQIDDMRKVEKTNKDSPEDKTKQKQPKQDSPQQDPPKQETTKQETPKQEPPKQEPPKQEPSKQEPPKQKPPKQEPPNQEPPKQKPPKQEPPKQKLPKDGPPKAPEPEPPTKPKNSVGNGGPDPKPNPPAQKPPPYDYNKQIEPLRPKRPPPDPNQKPPEFKNPWEDSSRGPPKDHPVSPNSLTPVQEPGPPQKPNEPLTPPKANDDVVPKLGDKNGKLPKTQPKPKHHPQLPHQEGKPKHWDVELGNCLKRGIDAAACNDKVMKYFEQAVDGRENHIVESAPNHGQGYHTQDVPDGPKPAGQQGLRKTGVEMDLAKDSTYSDIPTDLTEEQAAELNKQLIQEEMGKATTDAFDKADNAAKAPTAQKVERIGSALDGAADDALDDAAEQAGKKVKKMWKIGRAHV